MINVAMIITFASRDVRRQIMHARSAQVHRPVEPAAAESGPLLHFARHAGRYSLQSNGLPGRIAPAYALRTDAGLARACDGGDESTSAGDFVEAMSLDVFTKALAKTEVTIVVTRTYINVLGGQPERPAEPPRPRRRIPPSGTP
jgi:hypothetical protein